LEIDHSRLLRSPTSKTHDDFLESPDNGGSKSYSPPIQRNITTPDVRRASSGGKDLSLKF